MKFGLDIHGVIDKYPEVFSALSAALVAAGHEVHVITGPTFLEVDAELKKHNITYTHFCSIIEYNMARGVHVTYDKNGRGWMDTELWDRTKAEYCASHDIDLHIDDSEVYGKYFVTPYLKMEKKTGSYWTEVAAAIYKTKELLKTDKD